MNKLQDIHTKKSFSRHHYCIVSSFAQKNGYTSSYMSQKKITAPRKALICPDTTLYYHCVSLL